MGVFLKRLSVMAVVSWVFFLAWGQWSVHAEGTGTVVQSRIGENTTWTKAGSPYYVNAWVTIGELATLTIEPGVEVISQKGTGNGFRIDGHLIAIGTKEEPIKLTGMYNLTSTYANANRKVYLENTVLTNTDFYNWGNQLTLKNSEINGGYWSLSDPYATVEKNVFRNQARLEVWLGRSNAGSVMIKGNTFMNEGSNYPDIYVNRRNEIQNSITITENNFFRTVGLNVQLDGMYTADTYTGTQNYWGTTSKSAIESKIYDVNDNPNIKDRLSFEPFAYKPYANGYAFGALEAPRVQLVISDKTMVTGTTDSDAIIRIIKNGTEIAQVNSSADGTFQAEIPAQAAGTVLTVAVTDSFNRTSEANLTVKDETPPAAPVINPITNQTTTVTGTAEPNAAITVKANGTQLATGTADANGNYSIAISKQQAGTVIEVRAADEAGNVSLPSTVTVTDATPPAKPTISTEIDDKMQQVSGTAEAGATVEMWVGAQKISTVKAGSNGAFTLSWYPALKGGTEVQIVAVDNAGNRSEPLTLVVKDTTPPELYVDVFFPPTTTNPVVKGTSEPGATIQILKNGELLATGVADSSGKFSVTFPAQPRDTILTVRALDQAGNKIEETIKVLFIDDTPPAPPIVDEITVITTVVTGYTEPNITVKVVVLEGEGVGTYYGTSDANGHFLVSIPLQPQNYSVFIWAIDASFNESEMVVKEVITPSGWYIDRWGYKYYFEPVTGEMQVGWSQVAGKWYYFEDGGRARTNGFLWNGKLYYFNENGEMVTGWKTIREKRYYFETDGAAVFGLHEIDGKKYYFNVEGHMQTGWIKADGNWYYMNSDGTPKTGWFLWSTKWYFLNSDGTMRTGWLLSGGKWYFLNHSTGSMVTGWVYTGDKWYYMNSSGAMLTGWVSSGGKWYYMNSSGAMQTGWLKLGTKWYYLNTGGAMVTGWNTIGGKKYYFNSNGVWVK